MVRDRRYTCFVMHLRLYTTHMFMLRSRHGQQSFRGIRGGPLLQNTQGRASIPGPVSHLNAESDIAVLLSLVTYSYQVAVK